MNTKKGVSSCLLDDLIMRIGKRMFVLALIVVLSVSAVITPAYAAVGYPYLNDFSRFPGVWRSSQYAVAAVAVQKFLMLFGHSYAQELMPFGGADGYYGEATETQVKRFQRQERPHGGTEKQETLHSKYGKIDTPTWQTIAKFLDVEELIDTAGARFYRFNRSYYDLTENVMAWNGSGYYAYNNNSISPIGTPFYTY